MIVEGATWEPCTPTWVHRYNACGATIRKPNWPDPVALPIGHEHLMANGCPVLWTDALAGQRDRLQMEWRRAYLQGWGPDFTELRMWCPSIGCSWEHVWDDVIRLGEVIDVLTQHMKEVHGGS